MTPHDQLAILSLELRLARQNFARLLDECADVMDGKIKKRAQFVDHVRTVAECQRIISKQQL